MLKYFYTTRFLNYLHFGPTKLKIRANEKLLQMQNNANNSIFADN